MNMRFADNVIVRVEWHWHDWEWDVLDEFTEFGVWVLLLGPLRIVRTWTPATDKLGATAEA